MSAYENSVFISYAWGEEREQIVNEIDKSLHARGLNIIRDKRDLEYRGSIKKFMERIGRGDCVIVVVSDKYLKSPNCMYELVEIAENKDFENRIFPVVLADADIYKPVKQLQYIKYWEDQLKELKEALKIVDPTNLPGIYDQLNLYDRIRDNISRLTAILSDMNALTPEMQRNADFEALYTAIEKRLQGTVAASPESVYSFFQAAPANLRRSFDTLIADKIRNFVGRRFVFDALDEFLNKENSGYFIIRGVPGIGKSAFMAKLVNDRGYVHHFNIASQNIRSTRAFLENTCAQVIACYSLEHKEIPQNATDDSGFLVQCLSEAAAKRKDKSQKIVVAIDSLDEADRLGLASAVNNLFLPHSLPEGVYIVLTTRPLADVRLEVAHKQILDLEANSAGNLQDITEYIEAFMQRPTMQTRMSTLEYKPDDFLTALRAKSQGNFMYLYHVLPEMEAGKLIPSSVDDLPDGLLDYYKRHWRQMRDGKEEEFDKVYAPIVCILGVAQEPVTTEQIAAWTKLSHGQVKDSIGLWREFLEDERIDNRHCYRIYHASFQDFLKDQVDLVRFDDMIVEYYLSLSEQGK